MVKPSASQGLGHSLVSDDDLAERSEQARRDALADLESLASKPVVQSVGDGGNRAALPLDLSFS
jgi:hypothetical protein